MSTNEFEIEIVVNRKHIKLDEIYKYGINLNKTRIEDMLSPKKIINKFLRSNKYGNEPFLYICVRNDTTVYINQDGYTDIQEIKKVLDNLKLIGLIKCDED